MYMCSIHTSPQVERGPAFMGAAAEHRRRADSFRGHRDEPEILSCPGGVQPGAGEVMSANASKSCNFLHFEASGTWCQFLQHLAMWPKSASKPA